MESQFSNRWYEELARDLKSGAKVPIDPDITAAPIAAPVPAPIDFNDGYLDTFEDDLPQDPPAPKKKTKGKSKSKSKKKKKSDPLTNVILALSICIFLGSAGFLAYKYVAEPIIQNKMMEKYRESHKNDVAQSATNGVWENNTEGTDVNVVKEEARLDNGMLAAFKDNVEMNPDIIGWISVPNSPISYAVTQKKDDKNTYYLTHNVNKDYDAAGCPFLDYRNEVGPGKLSKCSIIYGHHRRNGTMFAKLKYYDEIDFYKQNPVITFDTIYDRAQWVVFANFRATSSSDTGKIFKYIKTSFKDDTEFLNFVAAIKKRSLINSPVEVNADDQLLILSTCSYEKAHWRMVIVARKVREGETKIDVSSAEINPSPLMP